MDSAIKETEATPLEDFTNNNKPVKLKTREQKKEPAKAAIVVKDAPDKDNDADEFSDDEVDLQASRVPVSSHQDDDDFDYDGETGTVAVQPLPACDPEPAAAPACEVDEVAA